MFSEPSGDEELFWGFLHVSDACSEPGVWLNARLVIIEVPLLQARRERKWQHGEKFTVYYEPVELAGIVDQIIDVPVSAKMDEFLTAPERDLQQRSCEEAGNVPQSMEQIVEVIACETPCIN